MKNEKFLEKFQELSKDEKKEIIPLLSPEDFAEVGSQLRSSIGREDPVWWIENTFKVRLWQKQKEIVEAVNKYPRVTVKSCHSSGKSFIAAHIVICFLECHENSVVITTAPTFRQVKKVLWQEIRSAYKKAARENLVKLDTDKHLLITEANVDDKWYAFGFSTDDPDAFNGIHAKDILVIFDEASGIPPAIWESAKGVLSSTNAHLLAIGNPTDPSSVFALEFKEKAYSHKIRISAYDTPNLTAFGITEQHIAESDYDYSKIEQMITGPMPFPALASPFFVWDSYHSWGPNSPAYSARVLGEFPEQGEDTLIQLGWIEAACERVLKPSFPREMSLDVAYMGSDDSVLAYRQGDYARIIDSWVKQDTTESAHRAAAHMLSFGAEIIKVDIIGYGAGVAEQLEQITSIGKSKVQKINVSEAATKPSFSEDMEKYHEKQFFNYRAELFWLLRERFEQGRIDIDPFDEDLKTELSMIKYKINNSGKIQIESKDDMRKRLRKSPDRADALAYLFAEKRQKSIPIVGLSKDLIRKSQWRRPSSVI